MGEGVGSSLSKRVHTGGTFVMNKILSKKLTKLPMATTVSQTLEKRPRGAWLAPSLEHASPDRGSRVQPTLRVEVT